MDYQEEQANEIEALESIYSEELEIISRKPFCFEVSVRGSNEDSRDSEKIILTADIRFTFVENYPDAIPLLEIKNNCNELNEERVEKLYDSLNEEASENLGMVMVFTLVSAAQDKLIEFVDNIKKENEDRAHREREEQRKLDEIKYKGTPVTLENFLGWKIQFDEEMRALGKRKLIDINKSKKLSGRQLFEQDSSLNESDVTFLTGNASAASGVKVDESLFQELDDLDLDEDFDDE